MSQNSCPVDLRICQVRKVDLEKKYHNPWNIPHHFPYGQYNVRFNLGNMRKSSNQDSVASSKWKQKQTTIARGRRMHLKTCKSTDTCDKYFRGIEWNERSFQSQ